MFLDSLISLFGIELLPASVKVVWVETSQHQIGIGNCGQTTPGAIAGGSRLGAGALRSHIQNTKIISPGDTTATSANGLHINHRQFNGILSYPTPGSRPGHAAIDDADVEGSPPHIGTYC